MHVPLQRPRRDLSLAALSRLLRCQAKDDRRAGATTRPASPGRSVVRPRTTFLRRTKGSSRGELREIVDAERLLEIGHLLERPLESTAAEELVLLLLEP